MSNSLSVNIAKILSSKVFAQIVVFGTAPVLTRLFVPHDFGILQIFMSIASIMIAVACLRYELSIPLGKSDKEASSSFVLSLFLAFAFSILALIAVSFSNGKVAEWFKTPELAGFLWLLPVVVLMGSSRRILRYWAARQGRFGIMAWAGFSSASGTALITLGWAMAISASVVGLFAGYMSGFIFSLLVLFIPLARKLIPDIRSAGLSPVTLWAVAKQHKKFPIFSTWSRLFNTTSLQLPAIILGLYFSPAVTGQYSLGQRIVGLPVILVGNSVSQVFFPVGARRYNETGNMSELVSNVFRRLVQIGVFPTVVLIFLSPMLFGFVFGEEWTEAGVYAQILAFWCLILFIYAPLSTTFSILGRQDVELLFNIALCLGRAISLLIGAAFWSARGALGGFVIFSVLALIGLVTWILVASKISIWWALKMMVKYIFLSCVLVFPVKFVSWIAGGLGVALALALAVIVYVVALFIFDSTFRNFALTTLRAPINRMTSNNNQMEG